jgi:hypothetical protein
MVHEYFKTYHQLPKLRVYSTFVPYVIGAERKGLNFLTFAGTSDESDDEEEDDSRQDLVSP